MTTTSTGAMGSLSTPRRIASQGGCRAGKGNVSGEERRHQVAAPSEIRRCHYVDAALQCPSGVLQRDPAQDEGQPVVRAAAQRVGGRAARAHGAQARRWLHRRPRLREGPGRDQLAADPRLAASGAPRPA